MQSRSERRLTDGRTVTVNRNGGLRKICRCPRRGWAKCAHPWHFNFRWKGRDYRFSLERHRGRRIESKTEAESLADQIKTDIRAGRFQVRAEVASAESPPEKPADVAMSFERFGELFIERSREREKSSWKDDEYMVQQVLAFAVGDRVLGKQPIRLIGEADIEAFIRHLIASGRASSTRNHYVQLVRAMSRWAIKKGYRETALVSADSDVVRRKKEAQRNRRLHPAEEPSMLAVAGDHLKDLIIAALETCCREGELLGLQWRDVSLSRGEIILRAHNTKDREDRIIPISKRLRALLIMRQTDSEGEEFGPSAFVFGNAVGERVGSVKRAWQTVVLKAHGHKPVWVWKKKTPSNKGGAKLSAESQAAYRGIDLHFHDLRHEAGSRLLEGGWPVHHVQHMLGHASLQQTSTYLNATLRGLHDSMRSLEELRAACNPVASEPGIDPRPARKQAPAKDGNPLIH